MARKRIAPQSAESDAKVDEVARDAPLSLSRLRDAFAAMLSPQEAGSGERGARSEAQEENSAAASPQPPAPDSCEINPRSVVEAMLFVGSPDNQSLSARELAVAMRGVSPGEIEEAVAELNAAYVRDAAPYEVTGSTKGYRLELRAECDRMRDKFYGRVREAKLSATVLETLSVVAYNQPATAEMVSELRGASSGAALAQLVRRKLLRLDRPSERGAKPQYTTTERFLRLFGLENLSALPRSEELEKA
jgi:segregation and condensation protein B